MLLAQKDPFEDWRRNMVNEAQMTYFQRQLKTSEGLVALQVELKGEAKKFKNFWMKELDQDRLFEDRTKFGPSGLKATQQAEKRMQAFKNSNWSVTAEGEMRNSTKRDLFQYFGTPCTGEQPSMANLSKLLRKSHTHGSNLEKLAKEEEKRQLALRRQLRAAKLCQDGGLQAKYKKAAKRAGNSPKGRFHKTLSTVT